MASISFNADLIDDLARERAVLFLGAGVSASAVTQRGAKIADWETFLSALCTKISGHSRVQALASIKNNDLLLACEILQHALSDEWERLIVDEFGQKAVPSTLHAAIVRLRQRIMLTTNFDKLLENSWETINGNETHFLRVTSAIDNHTFKLLKDHNHRYIVKIHGSIDDPRTIVFTRSEYIRLAFGNMNYSNFIENLLLNYTFIFIGFSMNDPAIISLMEMYALRYPDARPHYIFHAGKLDPTIQEIYKKIRKLSFINYDKRKRYDKLPEVIDEMADRAEIRRREIFADVSKLITR